MAAHDLLGRGFEDLARRWGRVVCAFESREPPRHVLVIGKKLESLCEYVEQIERASLCMIGWECIDVFNANFGLDR